MNQARRTKIRSLIERASTAMDLIAELTTELEEVRDEEREAFENLPESLQAGERGTTLDDNATALEEAVESFEEIDLATTIEKLEQLL